MAAAIAAGWLEPARLRGQRDEVQAVVRVVRRRDRWLGVWVDGELR